MNKFRKYSFWIALTGAVVVLVQTVLRGLGIELNTEVFESIILSFCGVLVVLGILVKDTNSKNDNIDNSIDSTQNSTNETSEKDNSDDNDKPIK